ncbi:MAG: hypothetical protein ACD_73C00092G0001, partial [uncultured bacterium]
ATGFIDATTGQPSPPTPSISDQAKLSLEQDLPIENELQESDELLDEIKKPEKPKDKPVSRQKNILLQQILNQAKHTSEQILVFAKKYLKNFSIIEMALLGVIILIVILSLIAFMIIFT